MTQRPGMILASQYETSCCMCNTRFMQRCNYNLTLIANIFSYVFQHKNMPPTGHRLELCLYSILILPKRSVNVCFQISKPKMDHTYNLQHRCSCGMKKHHKHLLNVFLHFCTWHLVHSQYS